MAKKKAKKPAPQAKSAKKVAKKAPARAAKKPAPKKVAAKKPAPKKAAAKKPAKKVAAKKPAPKKVAASKPAPKPKLTARPPQPKNVPSEKPRAARENDAAFVARADRAHDDLAEELGEGFVQSATSGDDATGELQNAETEEERGGPFIETSAEEEFADDVDASNPADAEPAALPTAVADDEEE